MANDNSRKFKQNQIIFCIQPWFVEFSRPVSYTHLDVYKRQVQPVIEEDIDEDNFFTT